MTPIKTPILIPLINHYYSESDEITLMDALLPLRPKTSHQYREETTPIDASYLRS